MDVIFTTLNGFLPFFKDADVFTNIALRVSDQTIFLLNMYVLASTILVGAITTGLVFKNARQMKGGVFGTVLRYFGIGMLFLLVGFFAGALSTGNGVYALAAESAHAVLYIVGYVVMAIAAHKLLTAIHGMR